MNLEQNKKEYYWKLLQKQVQEKRIEKIFDIFRANGFEPVLIKGWAAARKYPMPFERLSVDVDIAIDPKDYTAGQVLLKQTSIVGIDLHCGLRHLDTVDWEDLVEKSQLIQLNNTNIRILSEEDHLRVLCIHWLNDGGVSKNRLWDVFYAVENRSEKFDWDRCLHSVSKTRGNWIECTIGLAAKYLGLNLENTPLANKIIPLPKWLLKTIEKQWENEFSLIPLEYCLDNRKMFFEQLYNRIPPNPIQATIEMEGSFDESARIFYQLGSVFYRLKPSVKRIFATLRKRRFIETVKAKSIK